MRGSLFGGRSKRPNRRITSSRYIHKSLESAKGKKHRIQAALKIIRSHARRTRKGKGPPAAVVTSPIHRLTQILHGLTAIRRAGKINDQEWALGRLAVQRLYVDKTGIELFDMRNLHSLKKTARGEGRKTLTQKQQERIITDWYKKLQSQFEQLSAE